MKSKDNLESFCTLFTLYRFSIGSRLALMAELRKLGLGGGGSGIHVWMKKSTGQVG